MDTEEETPTAGDGRLTNLLKWFKKDLKSEEEPPPEIPRWFFIGLVISSVMMVLISIYKNLEARPFIPWYIFVAAILGTNSYLFTNILSRKIRTFPPRQAMTRFLAGPLVASGVYLQSQFLFDPSLRRGFAAAGIAFLAGFSMEVFVQAFNTFSRRLLNLPAPEDENQDQQPETEKDT